MWDGMELEQHGDGVRIPLRDMQDVVAYLALMRVPVKRDLWLHLERLRAVDEGHELAAQSDPPEPRQHL